MNENFTMRQSVKSLQKFKSVPLEQRVNLLSNQLLANPKNKVKPFINNKPSIQKQKFSHQQMAHKILMLENQLKQKISEDSLLRNFFKTLNTSKITHIDIYLQLKKCEEIIEPLQKRLEQQSEKSSQCLQYISKLQAQLQQSQKDAARTIVKLQNQISSMQTANKREVKQLKSNLSKNQNQLDNNRLLIAQLNKKNEQLIRENKVINKRNHELNNQNLSIRQNLQRKSVHNIHRYQQQKEELNTALVQVRKLNSDLKGQIEQLYASKAFNDKIKQLYQRSQAKIKQLDQIQYESHLKDQEINHLLQIIQQKDQQLTKLNQKLIDLIQNMQKKEQLFQAQITKINEVKNCSIQQLHRLKQSYKQLQKQYTQKQKDYEQKQKLLRSNLQSQKALLINDLNRQQFKDRDIESIVRKAQLQKSQQQKIISKLEDKVIELNHSNQQLKKKCLDIKKELQYTKSYEEINQRVYCQNFKTIGRIIQIAKQIKLTLKNDTIFDDSQQSLQASTSFLTKMSQLLITQFINTKQCVQMLKGKLYQRCKQTQKILNYLKKLTTVQNIQILIERYISLVNQQIKNNKDNSQEITQRYHLIIQRLMNAQNSKKPIIQDSLNTIRDSLERHSYQQKIEQQFNKQNIDLNQMRRPSKQQIHKISSHSNSYHLQSIGSTNHNANSIRNQIQRKYFRA